MNSEFHNVSERDLAWRSEGVEVLRRLLVMKKEGPHVARKQAIKNLRSFLLTP
jgi:hypothetical protein